MDRRDLQALSKARLIEAKALLKLGLTDGACYLAGYTVECAIKACIAKVRVAGLDARQNTKRNPQEHWWLQLVTGIMGLSHG